MSSIQAELVNAPNKGAAWRKTMQELYKILAEMTTDTSSDQRFNAPENRKRIDKNTKKLVDRAHDLGNKVLSTDEDPTVKMLSQLFHDETKRAELALKSGNRSYARGILNHVSSYCIACHTRNSSGINFSSLPLEPRVEPMTKNLSPLEKGRFYAATRQYDRALDGFQEIINDALAPIERPLEWEQAVRFGLSIAVRVKKDPAQARSLVERVIGSPHAPFFLKQDALKWKESIIQWKDELSKRALSEEGLRQEAIQLTMQAKDLQKYSRDRAADVLYLRATAVIHELLQKYPEGRYAGEALLMAGMCYEVIRPLILDELHEVYYEACIKKVPYTPTSEVCYRHFEQSVYEGFTGSGGTFLPEDLKKKLLNLENLSHPKIFDKSQIH